MDDQSAHRGKHRPDLAGKVTSHFKRADRPRDTDKGGQSASEVPDSIKRHVPQPEYNIEGPGRRVQQVHAADRLSKEAADAKKRQDLAKVQKNLQKSFRRAHDHSQGRDDGRN